MPTTPLFPYPTARPVASVRYLCESWWTCRSTPQHTWRNRSDALLATGEPLSIIPRGIREALDIDITAVPTLGVAIPSWFGVACGMGRVRLWLPIAEEPGVYRGFSLLALLPRDDLAEAPPFVHLGTQFLLEYRAQLGIDNSSGVAASSTARVVFP
jgi:hypothetical protein